MSLRTGFFYLFLVGLGGVCDAALAADLSYPSVSLCKTGFQNNYDSCGTYTASTACGAGYVDFVNTDDKFVDAYNGACQSGYTVTTLPSELKSYHPTPGRLSYPSVTLCKTGFQNNYDSCGTYTTSDSCGADYVDFVNTDDKFVDAYNGTCQSGYTVTTLPSELKSYHPTPGRLSYPSVTLCKTGPQSNHTCNTYAQGTCPDNYYDTQLPDGTFQFLENNSCASGYSVYNYAERFSDQIGIFGQGTIKNIDWFNWDGNKMTSSTCLYGGALYLPDITPTKEGFLFIGWSVNNNNSETNGAQGE